MQDPGAQLASSAAMGGVELIPQGSRTTLSAAVPVGSYGNEGQQCKNYLPVHWLRKLQC